MILSLKPSILSLFHDLGAFSQDLDLDLFGGERKSDLELPDYFFPYCSAYMRHFCYLCVQGVHGHGKGMDVQDIKAGSSLPGSCDKFIATAKRHHLSLK